MPLPTEPTTVWPPKDQHDALAMYRRWAAWWSGDLGALAKAYEGSVGFGAGPIIDGNADRQAMVALRDRSFHGAPAARGALQNAKLHIPLASDIATTSADLLFSEPPALVAAKDDAARRATDTVAAKPTPTQDRLDDFMANGLQAVLIESAEIAAAFGGVYIRVGWDTQIADRPLFDAIPPDAAVPEWRSGALTAVTFHRVLRGLEDGNVWRHLERHEKGRILHGLYCSGDDKMLGAKKALKDHPETEAFAGLVGGGDAVQTGAAGLLVEYVPNIRPNRKLRGSPLGRSDLDGIEGLMDALDESWSSWMRDLRLGKGRIMVPEVYLENGGRGQGALFDLEQEVFQIVNALPGASSGLALEQVQFTIRVAEHQQTTAALIEQAVRAAGYSAQSFGLQGDGQMATATEVQARSSRSYTTRGKKILYFRPALARLAQRALEIDAKFFKTDGVTPVLPDVEWPDGIAVDPQTQAQTLQLLKGAGAASTRTLVQMLNPEWDGKRVDEEVKAIHEEGMPPADPGIGAPGSAVAGGPAGGSTGGPGKDDDASGPPTGAGNVAGASGPGQPPTGTGKPRPGTPTPATAGRKPASVPPRARAAAKATR